MRMLRVFLAHEAVTQFRSPRFRGLAAVYVIAASTPAVIAYLVSSRTSVSMGSTAYNDFILSQQPFLTALLAAGLSVDAVARERDEGSFGVLSVAPISSAGYLLRRWIAILALSIPLTLLPGLIGAALAFHAQHRLPLLSAFAGGWLLNVLPSLLVGSALAIALGAITGRTVLAIIFGVLLLTAGIGILNDFLVSLHLNFGAPDELFAGGWRDIQKLMWIARGYWWPSSPSEAAFPLISESRMLLPRAGITAALAIVLLTLSPFYLRRTRRDLRPWRIRETHPLRTLLRTANRIREEYAPDSGSDGFDRSTLLIGCGLAALLIGYLVHRQSAIAALADERYAAETAHAVPTDITVVPESIHVDADVAIGGHLRSRGALVLRNSGPRPQSHVSFALNPGLAVRIAASRGALRTHRLWERLDVELDPPLASGESREMSFDINGLPGKIEFELQPPGNFIGRWTRYRQAKQSIYMTDLSRSSIEPAATEVRMELHATDLAPMLRYTPWTLQPEDRGEGFIPEAISPPTAIDIRLRHPYSVAADSCGAVAARAPLCSRCTTGLPSYVIFGGPFAEKSLAPGATLAYIPAHESLARTHAAALASSIRLALDSWPGLTLPSRLIFIERPRSPHEWTWYYESVPWLSIQQLGSSGAILFVPEVIFTRLKGIDAGFFSASIISGSLRERRRVIPEQAAFFTQFYTTLAIGRVGGRKSNAVEPGLGPPPETTPLLDMRGYYRIEGRMGKVLTSIEYRVGADHFVEGVNDFVGATPSPGTAKDLLEAIGRRGGVDLSRAYADYFAGRALPQLTLADVSFRRSGSRWEAVGAVLNSGSGEAFVPLALRTSQGSLWQTLRVDQGARVPFTFFTEAEPRSLQLDPERVCYRHASIGTVETIDYRGAS